MLLASYVLGHDRLISQTQGSTTSYFTQDAIGSTRALTNASGNVTESYTYSAFGELLDSTGTTTNSYRHAGQQYDALSGLYSMRARYYDPSMGRFLTQDTWAINHGDPVELNRYGYVAGNPVTMVDPSGHNALFESVTSLVAKFDKDRAFAGGIGGFTGGALLGVAVSLLTLGNQCGAIPEGFNPLAMTLTYAGIGAASGAVLGGFSAVHPLVIPAVGAVSSISALANLVANPNICNAIIFAVSAAGTALGTMGGGTGGPQLQFAGGGTTGAGAIVATTPEVIGGVAGGIAAGVVEMAQTSNDGDVGDSGNDDDNTNPADEINPPKFDKRTEAALVRIFKQYPCTAFKCDIAADEVARLLQQKGYENVQIQRIENARYPNGFQIPIMMLRDNTIVGTSGWHEVTTFSYQGRTWFVDAIVYKFDGVQPVTWTQYLNYWASPEVVIQTTTRSP